LSKIVTVSSRQQFNFYITLRTVPLATLSVTQDSIESNDGLVVNSARKGSERK